MQIYYVILQEIRWTIYWACLIVYIGSTEVRLYVLASMDIVLGHRESYFQTYGNNHTTQGYKFTVCSHVKSLTVNIKYCTVTKRTVEA